MNRDPLDTYLALCAAYYDLQKHKDHDAALQFYTELARQLNGPILEPMCGTGRFLVPLKQLGFAIEGFDASAHMLELLKDTCSKLAVEAPVWQEFIQDFSTDKLYKLIFIPYGSWGLILDKQEALDSLKKLYYCLQPGGKLVLEIDTDYSVPDYLGQWHSHTSYKPDGTFIVLKTLPTYNKQTGIFECVCIYELHSSGDDINPLCQTEHFKMYLYGQKEICKLLEQVGFKIDRVYSNYIYQEATAESPIVIIECSK